MINILIAGILLLPWVIVPFSNITDQFRTPKNMFFDIICLGIIAFAFNSGMNFKYKNKYLFWFIVWLFITFIFNWYCPIIFSSDGKQLLNLWTLEPMLHSMLAICATYIVLSTLDKEDYVKIAKFLCYSSIFVCIYGLMQRIGFDPARNIFKYYHGNHAIAFLDNPNNFGNYLALSVPLFLFLKEKKYKFMLGIVLIGVFLSGSYISMGVCLLGCFVYGFLRYRNHKIINKILLGLLIIAIPVGIFYIYQRYTIDGLSGRIGCWKIALTHLKDNSLFGQGVGVFKTWAIMPNPSNQVVWFTAHSDWFEIAIQFGILGLFLFSLIIINSIRRFNYSTDNRIGIAFFSTFIVFLALMLASFPFEIPPVALTGLISFWAVETL